MPEAIAIDFGTSRTKLAYWPAGANRPELMRFEWDRPFTASLFYLVRDSDRIVYGANAEEMLERDPGGIIDVLKRRLREPFVRANRRRNAPGELLTHFFTSLRQRARGIAAFGGQLPETVYLTVPVLYGPPDEQVLREAARHAGFPEQGVVLVPEPLAAARAWLAETGVASQDVIVLDCGGGTIDWAYLRRDGNDFRVVSECPPGGDRHVGGYDVDLELFERIKEQLSEEAIMALEQQKPSYLHRIRLLKEQYCRGVPLDAVVLAGQPVEISDSEMQFVFEARFVQQACESLRVYIDQVKAVQGGECPTLLLVGGSAQLTGLAQALEARFACQTVWWERSEFATVLGAMPNATLQRQPVRVSTVSTRRRREDIAAPHHAPAWPQTLRISLGINLGIEFVLIPAGAFRMGASDREEESFDNERPQPCVHISQPFYLGKYPVTQAQWEAVMQTSPSRFSGHPNLPVEHVSWEDVQRFLQALNAQEGGDVYRLPTEAEWEYAARAGSTTAYCFGNDPGQLGTYAWYEANAGSRTHPVGQKQPNAWGLYDMHGNVWEWVQDWYGRYEAETVTDPDGPSSGSSRVVRGGGWFYRARNCRSACRLGDETDRRDCDLGFRLLRRVS